MSIRRLIASLGLAAMTASCGEPTAPGGAAGPAPTPSFVRWGGAAPQFSAVGASTQGMVPFPTRAAFLVSPPSVGQASSGIGHGVRSFGWAHTVDTSASRLLLVGVSLHKRGVAVAGLSYGGTALTFLGAQNDSKGELRVELWYLPDPPAGTDTVAVSLSDSAKAVGGAVSFSGVDPTTPLRAFSAVGGSSNITDPTVPDASVAGELTFAVAALEGSSITPVPGTGQTQQYQAVTGTGNGEAMGIGGTAPGGTTPTMSWSPGTTTRWSIAAVVIRPNLSAAPPPAAFQAGFWAKRGESRTLQVNYTDANGTAPFAEFTVSDPIWAPGIGNLAVGDSVLMTATVDPSNFAVVFEPTGLQFGTPAQLQFWYGGAGGDLNGDGMVDAADALIESQRLGIWYQADNASAWSPLTAAQSLGTRSFTVGIQHFSNYAVAYRH